MQYQKILDLAPVEFQQNDINGTQSNNFEMKLYYWVSLFTRTYPESGESGEFLTSQTSSKTGIRINS